MLEIKTNEVSHLPVKIDDKEYKMKTYSAMPFKDYVKLQSFGELYSNLIKKDISKLTDKEIDTLSAGMEGMVNLVMEDCPTSVLDALSVTNKLALIQHFYRIGAERGGSQYRKIWYILPKLARFYGGHVNQWLETDYNLVEFFAEQMQVIQAEERLARFEDMLMAQAEVKDSERQKYMNRLQKYIEKQERATKQAQHLQLQMMGIGVTQVDG